MGYVQAILSYFSHVASGVSGLLDAQPFLLWLVNVLAALGALSVAVSLLGMFRGATARGKRGGQARDALYVMPSAPSDKQKDTSGPAVASLALEVPEASKLTPQEELMKAFTSDAPPALFEAVDEFVFPDTWDAEALGLSEELFSSISGASAAHWQGTNKVYFNPSSFTNTFELQLQTLYHEAIHAYERRNSTIAANYAYYRYLRDLEGEEAAPWLDRDPEYFDPEEFVAEAYGNYKTFPDDLALYAPRTYHAMQQLDEEIRAR